MSEVTEKMLEAGFETLWYKGYRAPGFDISKDAMAAVFTAMAEVQRAENADAATVDHATKELDFQGLLTKFHEAVWNAAETGEAFDLAGNKEAKELIQMFNGVPAMSDRNAIAIILNAHIKACKTRLTGTTNWAGDIWHALKRGTGR